MMMTAEPFQAKILVLGAGKQVCKLLQQQRNRTTVFVTDVRLHLNKVESLGGKFF